MLVTLSEPTDLSIDGEKEVHKEEIQLQSKNILSAHMSAEASSTDEIKALTQALGPK